MKAVLIALSLCSNFLFASDQTIVECKLTKLHDSTYFREALSLDEYPEVEIVKNTRTGLNVKIGASKYTDEEDGWTIVSEPNAIGGVVYTVEKKKIKHTIKVVVDGVSGRESGRIWVTEKKKKERLIADFKCYEQ